MNHIKFAQPYFLREAMTSGMMPGKEDDDKSSAWGWTSATGQQSQQQGDTDQGNYDPATMDPYDAETFEIFMQWFWGRFSTGGAANKISTLTPSGVDIRQWWYDMLWNIFFPPQIPGDAGDWDIER